MNINLWPEKYSGQSGYGRYGSYATAFPLLQWDMVAHIRHCTPMDSRAYPTVALGEHKKFSGTIPLSHCTVRFPKRL